MKKISLILLTLILTFVLLVVEVIIVKSVSRYEPEFDIVYAKTRIHEDTILQPEMLQEKKVNASLVHRQSIRSMKEIIGKKVKVDIEEGEMMLSPKLYADSEIEEIKITDKNNRLFSIEFKGDQANGWWLGEDQFVDIIFVPGERLQSNMYKSGWTDIYPVQRLRNIRIAALIDDRGKLLKKGEKTTLPRYVSFEVTDEQVEFLAFAKGSGRLEISVIPGK